jgi:hypothetical protein
MRKYRLALIIISLYMAVNASQAYAEWVFQLGTGTAYNIPTRLEIEQNGYEKISLTAEYDTKAWETFAWYYDFRMGWWKDGRAWELETIHHKLYLDNKPPEVESFSISHGYNLNYVNRAWRTNWPIKNIIYRVGAGIVITHPETTVRGKEYENDGGVYGFHFGGVTGQVAAEKRFPLSTKVFFSLEAKFTASYAEIPIADGEAKVPNLAVHGIFGLGYVMDKFLW